jgi:hypothetical protein
MGMVEHCPIAARKTYSSVVFMVPVCVVVFALERIGTARNVNGYKAFARARTMMGCLNKNMLRITIGDIFVC